MKFKFFRDGGDFVLVLFAAMAFTFGFVGAFASCRGCGDEMGPAARDLEADAGEVLVLEEVPDEAEVATVFVQRGNKRIRVVGVQGKKGEAVVDYPEGRGVVKQVDDDLDVERLSCQVILEAPIRPVTEKTSDGVVFVGNMPEIPALEKAFGVLAWPVLLPGSCTPGPHGLCFWSALLKGQDCIDVLDAPQYVGSTMAEFMALPPPKRARLLTQEGLCDSDEGEKVFCDVPFGDPRALPHGYVKLPHSWAGRSDLNFVRAKDGEAEARYKVPAAKATEFEAVER